MGYEVYISLTAARQVLFMIELYFHISPALQDISLMLSLAADAVEELSKDSPSGEVVEYKTKDF